MKKEKKIKKNYCEICGLKIKITELSEEEAKKNEDLFNKLTALGLRKKMKYTRNIADIIGPGIERSYTEFCALGSEKFRKSGKNCKDFQLKLDLIELADFISIANANKNARSANRLIIYAIIISIIGLSFILWGQEVKSFLENLFYIF